MEEHKVKIVIVTQDDPFYVPIFFRNFFANVSGDVKVLSIVCLDPFMESTREVARRVYRLYGPVNFLRRSAEYAGRKVMDAVGLGRYSVKSIAKAHDVDIRSEASVNTSSFVREIRRRDVDVVLSVAAPEIFNARLLNAPTLGCFNVHSAALPQYRGMLPTFWALYHDDDEVGVTVHTMEEEIDQGQIAKQTTFPVSPSDTLDDVIKRGKKEGGRAAAQTLNRLAESDLRLQPMEGEESYFSFPTAEERRELQQKGRRLL